LRSPARRHVHHRLERHRAGRRTDDETACTGDIASANAEEIDHAIDYVPIADDALHQPKRIIADLI
jgi:hypothetical protein